MIALDTNVLVRFLVEDDADQTEHAKMLIRKMLNIKSTCFISNVVLCETVWVLRSCYHFDRKEISNNLGLLLNALPFVFASLDPITRALNAFRSGRGDFADYIIQECARSAGCKEVATFDQELLKESGFFKP